MFAVPAVLRHRPRTVYLAAALASAAFLLAATTVFLPAHAERRSARALVESAPDLHGDRPVVVVEMRLPSLTWYLDRIPEKVSSVELAGRLRRGDDPLLVFDRVDLALVEPALHRRLAEIARAGKYRLLEARPPSEPAPGSP